MADNAVIGPDEFERIIQSLVTFADTVLLPASLRVSQDIEIGYQRRILDSLSALMEAKRISLWQYPGIEMLPETRAMLTTDRLTEVLDQDSYMEFYEKVLHIVEERVRQTGDLRSSLTDIRHSTTAMVYFRNSLWPCFLAGYFDTDRVVYSPGEMAALVRGRDLHLYQTVEENTISVFLSEQRLPKLSILSAPQILRLNKKNRPFREAVQGQISKLSVHPNMEIEVKAVVEALFREYYRDINELLREQLSAKKLALSAAKSALTGAVSIVGTGALVILSSIMPIADSAIKSLRKMRKMSAITAYTARLRYEIERANEAEGRDSITRE